jgi:hypothetical protein
MKRSGGQDGIGEWRGNHSYYYSLDPRVRIIAGRERNAFGLGQARRFLTAPHNTGKRLANASNIVAPTNNVRRSPVPCLDNALSARFFSVDLRLIAQARPGPVRRL